MKGDEVLKKSPRHHRHRRKHNEVKVLITRLCEKEKVFHNVCKNFPLPDQRSPQVQSASNKVVRHISKILMTPQQYEIFTSHIRHR